MSEERATTLLKATYDMLKKLNESHFVESPFETTVFYDEAECDGHCLMDDILIELNERGIDPNADVFVDRKGI